jgi:hypothetical protein
VAVWSFCMKTLNPLRKSRFALNEIDGQSLLNEALW